MVSSTLANLIVVLAIAGVVTVPTILPPDASTSGGTQPTSSGANKVVATGEENIVFGPGSDVVLMEAWAHTSKVTDMMFMVSLECAIKTALITGPSEDAGATDMARAQARLDVWIEVDDVVVPISSASSPPNEPPAPGDRVIDSVTFCDQDYKREVTDGEDPLDGLDKEDDYIATKAAYAFNWIRQNMGSDKNHHIEVVGELVEETEGEATASIEVGNRVLIAEPTMMSNRASI